jgi:hypothetical protein
MRALTTEQRVGLLRIFEHTKTVAKSGFERGCPCPCLAIFVSEDRTTPIYIGGFSDDEDSAGMALIRRHVDEIRPLAVIIAGEARIVTARSAAAAAVRRAGLDRGYGGRLAETPPAWGQEQDDGQVRGVIVQCYTVTGECFTVGAEVVSRGARRVLGPWLWERNQDAVKRFIFEHAPRAERQ